MHRREQRRAENDVQAILRFYIAWSAAVAIPTPAHAIFGVGDVVFDPTMFASQLQQLHRKRPPSRTSRSSCNMSSRTRPAAAPASGIEPGLLNNLGGLIYQQQGLSYTFQGLAQQFQQHYPGYSVTTTPGVQSPLASVETTFNTLNGALQSAQSQAQNFQGEQAALQTSS